MTLSTDYRHLSAAIVGTAGLGKTTLAVTVPGPRLVLDYEGGTMFALDDFEYWDVDESDVPPDADSVVVVSPTWMQLDKIMNYLEGKTKFESVVFDSLTRAQENIQKKILLKAARDKEDDRPEDEILSEGFNVSDDAFVYDLWGKYARHMQEICNTLQRFSKRKVNPLNVVVIVGVNTEGVKEKFELDGKIRRLLAGYFDVVGRLQWVETKTGDPVRALKILPTNNGEDFLKSRPKELRKAAQNGFIKIPNLDDDTSGGMSRIIKMSQPKKKEN